VGIHSTKCHEESLTTREALRGSLHSDSPHVQLSSPVSHILVQSPWIHGCILVLVIEWHVLIQLPELGMSQFEVLSRASAFAITLPSRPPLLLSSRHVTHPHHYLDSYYQDKEWLAAVNNRSLRYSLEVYKVCLVLFVSVEA
jgi:hypothetical protein